LRDPIILTGSCFSENIGEILKRFKFNVISNPFGTIYNPVSIFYSLSRAIHNPEPKIIQHNEVFYDWDSHSKISALTEEDLRKYIRSSQEQVLAFIRKAEWIVITPGTAKAYFLSNRINPVANCHKVPQSKFSSRLLDHAHIMEMFEKVYLEVKEINPNMKWIFTVSPVRHIRDGLVENNISKSILVSSVHQIIKKFDDCYYFPSYEIQIDQLRDYRFYAKDRVHPNEEAIDFIWKKFSETFMDTETLQFITEWDSLQKSLTHKPFHPQSDAHQKFVRQTIEKLKNYSSIINVEQEIASLTNQLV
jgi:hypothetical protein